jgi:RHS repeat-associated protein
VAQVLTVDGAVTASGVRGGAGASGGSIHVAVGALAGAGRLSADGSPGNWGSSGGGGRVAVYHWGSLDLPTDHITAAAGGGEAQAGSVVVSNAPLFLWSEPTGALFHGTELLVWDGLAVDWLTVTVDVTAYGPLTASLGEGLPCLGQTEWDTTLVPDGAYELRATFRDGAGAVVGEAVRSVLVSNAYGWHGGTVAADETWAAGTVHVIETYLTLAAGVRVTVEPGAVVKVARDVQITVEDGAVLDAQGIEAAPIVFTSLLDDSVAGDTNFDGDDSLPRPGDWAGIALTGAGQFATSGHTDLRYLTTTHSGVLTTDQIWVGSLLHHVTGDVVVPAGVTLSINPGATVKLDLGRGLTVQPGGVLMAPGTTAQPVVFTSIRDDSVGGDTNGDGDTTAPAPGDWKRLHIDGGRAEFDHCDIRYGAGPDNVQDALIRTSGNAELTVINSRLADGFYTGVLCWGGTAVLTSTLITGLDRGVSAHPGGTLQLTNCTLDDNRVGALVHGGVLSLTNSIVSHSTQHGLDWDLGGTGPAVRYCDVWGSGTQNYHTVADQTGLNGNISADPQYRDRARGDFRLDYLSPCVDAADSTAAPASDHMGAPRYDDPRTPNTGIPDAGGAYADMGAFEFVETAASDVDLVVTQVIGPTEATAGETVTVRWTVRNNGSSTAVGPWHDAVALVRDPDTNPVAVSAGEALVGTGVGLGPGESVTLEGDVRVPGSTLGFHRWQVTANRRGEVFEGSNTANNTTVSSAQVALSLPVLALGHGGLTGQFTAAGEEHWFAVTPGAGQDVLLSLDLLGDGGTTELYIGCGYMPSREHFDVRQTEWHAADTTAVLAGTNGQTYYVLAYAASLGAPDAAFALQAQAIEFSLSAVSPTACGRGRVTFKLQGGKLAEDMQYDLVGPGRTAYPAVAVFPVNSATIHPTFDLTGAALGTYTVQVTSQGVTHALPGAIGVEDTGPGWVAFDIVAPSATRPDWTFPVVVNYANRGSTDVVAPLFRVDIENANALVPSPSDSRQRLFERLFTSKYMLGIPAEGPAGVLPPGASGAVTLEATCTGSPTRVGYVIASYGGPEFPIDLESLRADMQPGWVPDDAWQAAFASFVAAVGPSSAAYQQAMADDATHLSRFGVRTHDVARLSAFELRWDGLYGVVQRYHLGAFGRGPSHPWDIRVCREERRGWQLVRYGSGLVRPFLPSGGASPDVYAGAPGDPGTLSLSADGAEAVLTEHDGTRLRFFAGPSDPAESQSYRLGSVEEMNGKRTTLTYLDGRVTDVTLGSGDTLTFTYNSAGRVTAMTDWVGRVTSFAYDPAGEHVAAVTDARGTTQFEHVTGRGAAREHALAAITYRDGTHTFFEYDDFGRLARQWRDGGAEEVRMRYDAVGTQSVINALGGTAVLLVGEFGYVGAYRDPLGRETTLNRDLSGKLLSAATRNGPSAAFSYDATGNVLSVLDPLGARLQFAYGPCAHLSGFTDARGASTAYARDARSNLAGITYPDGARCQFTYDDRGNPVRWVNARGEATSYTYDSHRLLVRKERDDGYWVEYAYDGHRNLLAATDPNGTTAFEYDAADRVTQVSYPNGKSLAYAYDAGGRRSRMTDGIGYTVDYTYDAVGRLRQLSDGAGSPMVTYSYDAVGRVVRSDLGNGTCTTYDFDAVGNVLQQATHATDGAALSRFDCSYDTLGRLTGTTTLDGTWAYSYDAAGQLTGVVLPSGEAVRYTYDAMGNRTAVEDNGSMTHYSTNALNQYTAVGGAQYQYDADGNLVRKVDGADSWHYAYDGEGHLVTAVTPSGTWVYTYDALGQRIAGTRDGQATEYVIDPFGLGDVVAEYSGDGALVANYVHGLGLVSRLDPAGGAAYYAFDPAANTVALTDAADAVVNRYTYLPFGEIVSSSEALANPFTFVGLYGVMADAAGLCYMRNRWYDPCTGRFVQRDPLGISGGDVNLAVYARNRPIAVVDPLGLSAIPTGMTSRRSDASFAPMTTGYSPQPTEAAEVTGLGLGYVHAGSWQMDPAVLDSATASPGSLGSNYDDFDANAWGGPQWGNSSDFLFLFTPAGTPHTNWLPNFDSEFHIVTVDGVALNDVYDLCSELPTAKGASARMAPPELVEYCLLLGSGDSDVLTSGDPNDIVGPGGVGESHWLTTQMLPYMVRFENDPELANAAAQQVVVTLPLDTTLDWSTFELTGFGFGSNAYHLTGGLQAHTERLALREELGLCVDVDFALDPATGLVTWRFTSIDPVTGQPTRDPLAGFLPPNITSPEGQGYVTYTVRPLASLVTGDTISAKASIIFDTNRRHRHEHACQHHRCGSPGGCGDRTAGRGTLSGLPGELVGRG